MGYGGPSLRSLQSRRGRLMQMLISSVTPAAILCQRCRRLALQPLMVRSITYSDSSPDGVRCASLLLSTESSFIFIALG